MSLVFRFRPVPFVATLLAMAIGIAAGQWQTRRAVETEAIEAIMSQRAAAPPLAIDARPFGADAVEYRKISVSGTFLPSWPLFLDNRPYRGAAGLYVLMPFRIAGSRMHVLIARGWVPRDPSDRKKLPVIPTPAGEITLQGMARRNPGKLLQLGQPDPLRPGPSCKIWKLPDLREPAACKCSLSCWSSRARCRMAWLGTGRGRRSA